MDLHTHLIQGGVTDIRYRPEEDVAFGIVVQDQAGTDPQLVAGLIQSQLLGGLLPIATALVVALAPGTMFVAGSLMASVGLKESLRLLRAQGSAPTT